MTRLTRFTTCLTRMVSSCNRVGLQLAILAMGPASLMRATYIAQVFIQISAPDAL